MSKPCGTKAGSPIKACIPALNQSAEACQKEKVIKLSLDLFKTDKAFRNAWLNYVMPEKLNAKHWQPTPMNLSGKFAAQDRREMTSGFEQAKASNSFVKNGATTYVLDKITSVIQYEKILDVINGLGIFKLAKDAKQQWQAFSPKNNNTKGCDWASANSAFREHVILLLLEQERKRGGRKTRNARRNKTRRSTRRN